MRDHVEHNYRTESPAFTKQDSFFIKCAYEAQNVHEHCASAQIDVHIFSAIIAHSVHCTKTVLCTLLGRVMMSIKKTKQIQNPWSHTVGGGNYHDKNKEN